MWRWWGRGIVNFHAPSRPLTTKIATGKTAGMENVDGSNFVAATGMPTRMRKTGHTQHGKLFSLCLCGAIGSKRVSR